MNIEEAINQRRNGGGTDRIIVYTVDTRSGEVLNESTMKAEFYDAKDEDALRKLFERAEEESVAQMLTGAPAKSAESELDKKFAEAGINPNSLFNRIFGFPIWTQDRDGDLRERRAKFISNTEILTTSLSSNIVGTINGRFPMATYVVRWWPRKTLWSTFKKKV